MREQKFYAASLGYNNPIQEVIGEAERVFGSDKKASVILSIGSGRPQVVSLDPSLSDSDDLNNILTRMLADCEQVAQEIAKQLEILGPYLRLNVDRGVEEVQIFEWDKLGAIETHTTVYLSGTAITKDIDRLLIALQGGSTSATLGQLGTLYRHLTLPPIYETIYRAFSHFSNTSQNGTISITLFCQQEAAMGYHQ